MGAYDEKARMLAENKMLRERMAELEYQGGIWELGHGKDPGTVAVHSIGCCPVCLAVAQDERMEWYGLDCVDQDHGRPTTWEDGPHHTETCWLGELLGRDKD